MDKKRIKAHYRELEAATTYDEWAHVAAEIDILTGAAAWRAEDRSALLDGPRLRDDIARMDTLQRTGAAAELARLLHSSLHLTIGDLTHAPLYDVALAGTKHIIDEYMAAVEGAIAWLVQTPRLPRHQKRTLLTRADREHGRPALMLSGGATLGFYHLGVVKALWQAGLLPRVLCGASMGAMIAAGIATRTDDEISALWGDLGEMRRIGLIRLPLWQALRDGAVMEQDELRKTVRHNIGHYTFQQAHARTGRTLNVSVSPTRASQSPRLLSHVTAPDAVISQATLASGAIPLAFPPVQLTALDPSGQEVPYLPEETWIDGSMHSDLPKMRLSRLHNVNRFIVSQTNPHVLPFLGLRGRRGVVPVATRLLAKTAWTRSQRAIQLAAKITEPTPLHGWVNLAAHATGQEWRGDIDIHPRFRWDLFKKVASNPTLDELHQFVLEGERATWPRIETIRQHTRLSRILQDAIAQLDAEGPAAHLSVLG